MIDRGRRAVPPRSCASDRRPRVLITGIGLWTGLGADRESTWQAIRASKSAARQLGPVQSGGLDNEIGCPLAEAEDLVAHTDPALAIVARTTVEALADAGVAVGRTVEPDRAATLVGLSKGCVHNLGRLALARHDGRREPAREVWPALCWPNAGAGLVASTHDLRGPCLAPIAACATGLVAVLQGVELIRRGVCDLAVAGSADSSLEPMLLAAFRKMGVLARPAPGDDPMRAVRPWDRHRSGFVVGEGGAIVVLEREDTARERGALPYAEVAGGALGADAFHETGLNPDPSVLADLIARALAHAGVAPAEIDHVNVHGTATPMNDPLECRALRRALGQRADHVACSASKSQIGHLLGAAGAAELAMTCLAIRDGFVPPTLNLDEADPACDLDGTPHCGRALPIGAALKLSIGFGGHLAAAVLRRPEEPRRGP